MNVRLSPPPARGFSRTDLISLLATGALLTGLLLTSAAGSRRASESAACRRNLGALSLAWQLYAADNRNQLVAAAAWTPPGGSARPDWAGGSWLDLNQPRNPNNWDHAAYTERSPLWRYLKRREVFNCPADPSRALTDAGSAVRRIRSYGLNAWTGGPGWDSSGPWVPQATSGWRVHRSLDDFHELSPKETFTFLDEREDSLNDGYFIADMRGFQADASQLVMVDYPSDLHSGGGQFAFADGHVEAHRWQDARTRPPHRGLLMTLNVRQPNNPDITWLQVHATRRTR